MGVLEFNISFLLNQKLIFPEASTVEGVFLATRALVPYLLCLIKIGFLIIDVFFSALNKKQVMNL